MHSSVATRSGVNISTHGQLPIADSGAGHLVGADGLVGHHHTHGYHHQSSAPHGHGPHRGGSYNIFGDEPSMVVDGPNSNSSHVNGGGNNGNNGGPITLFDAEVPVHVRHLDREEVYQPLGVCVTVGRGGPTGVSKCVTVRLTDPKDPFFLFSMTLLEDDYGRFKERHELMVDFNGFPRDLVGMLSGIGGRSVGGVPSPSSAGDSVSNSAPAITGGGGGAGNSSSGGGNNIVTFVADSKDSCVLRILEKTEFRALEHIALAMSRQGDVGQKKYLADRFQHFLGAFRRSERERRAEVSQYERVLAECRAELAKTAAERDALLDRTRTDASASAAAQLSALSVLKDEHAAEVRRLTAAAEEVRAALTRKADQQHEQHRAEMKEKEEALAQLRASAAAAESSSASLASQLRLANDTVAALSTEVEQLRADKADLTAFKTSATAQLTERELAHVAATERIRHLTESLASRENDVRSLREAQGSQDGYAKMLAGQLASLQEKARASEASLSKAHHILGTQVQALRSAKDKHVALKGQIDANETLLGEKNNLIERLRGDLNAAGDKYEHLSGQHKETKAALQRSEENAAKLATQLKQSEDALVHMQRMGSGFGARTFGAGSPPGGTASSSILSSAHPSGLRLGSGVGVGGAVGATGASSSSAFPGVSGFGTTDLYKQFASPPPASAARAAASSLGSTIGAATSGAAAGETLQSEAASTTGGSPTTAASASASATVPSAATITANNHLLTGYNSLASGAAVLSNLHAASGVGASTYPYTTSSPTSRSSPLPPHFGGQAYGGLTLSSVAPLPSTASQPPLSSAATATASSVAYLPPKLTVGAGAYATERPSSYFGN